MSTVFTGMKLKHSKPAKAAGLLPAANHQLQTQGECSKWNWQVGLLKKNKLKQIRPQFLGLKMKKKYALQNAPFPIEVPQNNSEDNKKP